MPIKILILTDGKVGNLVQCQGVASHLTKAEFIEEKAVSPRKLWSLPFPFIPVQISDRAGKDGSPLNQPFPDLIIASGRRTLPYLRAIKRLRNNSKTPLLVYLKDPRMGGKVPDFIWAPTHDKLTGTNIFSTHTSPHTMTKIALAKASKSAKSRFLNYPAPVTGIILGGNSGSVQWDTSTIQLFTSQLEKLPNEGSYLITPSMRTPRPLLDSVTNALKHRKCWVWDRKGENPYLQILTLSDRLIVTGDSHNMVSECLTTNKPIFVHRPAQLQTKLHEFLDTMEQLKAVKNLEHGLINFKPVKFDATLEIATAIQNKL